MAHVGQELALGLIGRFGLTLGLEQVGDVVIERHDPDDLALHKHGDTRQLHVDHGAVLPTSLADGTRRGMRRLSGVGDSLGEGSLIVDQRVEILPQCLGL
ncbi:MAG: hypothetical protein ABIR59_02110 [Gemmatimonadales bacterium]